MDPARPQEFFLHVDEHHGLLHKAGEHERRLRELVLAQVQVPKRCKLPERGGQRR